jgi:hypothetical protein
LLLAIIVICAGEMSMRFVPKYFHAPGAVPRGPVASLADRFGHRHVLRP